MAQIKEYWHNNIDGAWIDVDARRIDVIDPGTGQRLAQHAMADAGDLDRAVLSALAMHFWCLSRSAPR